jgi:hypothetical protein
MSFLNFINPMSKFFLNTKEDANTERENALNLNRVGYNATDIATYRNSANSLSWNSMESNGILFDGLTENKRQKVILYREMALYPLIRKALSTVADETITENTDGNCVLFGIKKAYQKEIHESELKELKEQFDYVVNCVIKQERLWYYYYQWLIDGEQIWEKVPDSSGKKLVGINILPCYNTIPIYYNGKRIGFMQDASLFGNGIDKGASPKTFNVNQIAYCNYAFCGEAPVNNIYGYLEPVIRHVNQLRAIEDALTVYRVTRAPEKRIFKIFVGKTPPAQIPAKIKKLKEEYRKELNIDAKTGVINTNNRVQSFTEDFYLPILSGGEGSSLESFKGSNEFNGQIEDLKMLRQQVADGLLLPAGRWDDTGTPTTYSSAPEQNMTEISFQRMCRRNGKTFCNDLILNVFISQLKLQGYNKKYLDPAIYNINFNNAQDFQRIRELSIAEKISGILTSYSSFLPTLGNSKNDSEDLRPLFAKSFLFENILGISAEDMMFNEAEIKKEQAKLIKSNEEKNTEGGKSDANDDSDVF